MIAATLTALPESRHYTEQEWQSVKRIKALKETQRRAEKKSHLEAQFLLLRVKNTLRIEKRGN